MGSPTGCGGADFDSDSIKSSRFQFVLTWTRLFWVSFLLSSAPGMSTPSGYSTSLGLTTSQLDCELTSIRPVHHRVLITFPERPFLPMGEAEEEYKTLLSFQAAH